MRTTVPALCALLLAGAVASAQEFKGVPRLLVDRRLEERPVLLTALDNGTIKYTDAAGLPRSESSAEYLAILPRPAPLPAARPLVAPAPPVNAPDSDVEERSSAKPVPAPPDPLHQVAGPLVELTDGQRFAGGVLAAPSTEPSEQDTLRWATPALGTMSFKLDQLRRIRLHDGAWAPDDAEAQTDDVLVLSNGDRLHGFVESVGGASVRFTVGDPGKGETREVPLDRVYEVWFANPRVPPGPRSAVAWLRDGSVISCRVVHTGRLGEVTLGPTLQKSEAEESRAEEAGALRLDDVLAVSLEGGGAMLKPLATIAPVEQTPGVSRRWTRPVTAIQPERAVLGAADLDFPGPMSVQWELPKGATRFAAQAELPIQSRTWGDCDLIVSAAGEAGEKEVFRQHLSAEAPTAAISVSLPESASRLIVRIDAGPLGPIQDHVVMHRPLLLLGK